MAKCGPDCLGFSGDDLNKLSAIVGVVLLIASASVHARAVPCSEERDNVDDLVSFCKEVSPATHPPCNAENECSLIESEISRGCRMMSPQERPAQCKGF